MRRRLRTLAVLAALAAASAAAWIALFAADPLSPPRVPFEFTVKPGASLRTVARTLAEAGLLREAQSFWILGRLRGLDTAIQAGTYRLEGPITPRELLDKLRRGDVVLAEIAFIEGTTFRQWLAQLAQNRDVRHLAEGRSPRDVAIAVGIEDGAAEGWLFPDTYRFAPGQSDIEILKKAHGAMKKRLQDAWGSRDPDVPLRTPLQALILASIVEKETGSAAERPLVASVFVNRLTRGMRLQTDPTVIYGMGEAFDGNIRKKDLLADTPWNTYTRDGLPPTPIAMPGAASLAAVTRPASSPHLYFVGRGDGTHQFSRTLEEHNRAVAKYQLRK